MANVICPVCGKEFAEGAKFCTSCGAKLEVTEAPVAVEEKTQMPESAPDPEIIPEAAPAPEIAPEPPKAPDPAQIPEAKSYFDPAYPPAKGFTPEERVPEPQKASKAKPHKTEHDLISTWGFVGIFIIMMIPFFNLLFLIIWACGGCRKIQKQSFARACLALIAISLVITLIGFIVLAVALTQNLPHIASDLSGWAVDTFGGQFGFGAADAEEFIAELFGSMGLRF